MVPCEHHEIGGNHTVSFFSICKIKNHFYEYTLTSAVEKKRLGKQNIPERKILAILLHQRFFDSVKVDCGF